MLLILVACGPTQSMDAGLDANVADADRGVDAQVSEGTPADTYFAVAITDDSRNHTGDRLLFLDFADRARGTFDTQERGNRVVQAPFSPGAIEIDGADSDWAGVPVTTVRARPQNNYVLSAHYDAVPLPIELSAAYDDERIYMRVRWEDPGHAVSDRWRMWTFDGSSARWQPSAVAPLKEGAPNESVVNASDVLSGLEDQDRVMFMFPVRDPEAWFTDGGLGCAGLCHGNLSLSGDPSTSRVGTAAAMSAGLTDALVDTWEWEAARTGPSGYADDLWLGQADDLTMSGFAPDDGEAAYELNRGDDGQPAYMDPGGFSQGATLALADAVSLSGAPNDGDTVPGVLARPPSGSRADVISAARYDEATHTWTLELARARDTGHDDDRAFVDGVAAQPPADVTREPGDARAGAATYNTVCSRCHGSQGQGVFGGGTWMVPRVQRTGSSLVAASLERVTQMEGLPMSPQDVEDVAAFLRNLHTPAP